MSAPGALPAAQPATATAVPPVVLAERTPPTIDGLPVLGNLPEAARDLLGLVRRAATLGDVVRLRFIEDVHLIVRPDLVKHVLQDNHLNYRKGRTYERIIPLVGHGLLTSEGDFWKRQRRLAQPAFHRQRIADLGGMMVERTARMLERWDARPAGEAFDIHEEMMALTLTVVGEALFSVDLSGAAKDVGRALGTTLAITDERFRAPILFPAWVPTPGNVRFNRAKATLDGLVNRIIAERHRQPDQADDLLSMLMAARDEDGERMSDAQLADEVMTLLLAGHETTANALSWWVHLMGHHPLASRRLTEEVDRVLGDRPPALADLPELAHTRRSLDEAMRLYPPAFMIGRKAIADDVVDGVRIPAGSTVLLSSYITGRDPRQWESPGTFDPDRFLPERSKGRHPLASFPFAAGPRQCIGNNFALMEMQIIGAMIAQRFELELVEGRPIVPVPNVTLRPGGGVWVVAHRRDARSPRARASAGA